MARIEVVTQVGPVVKDFYASRACAEAFARDIEPRYKWDDANRRMYGKEEGYDKNFKSIPGQKPLTQYIREFKDQNGFVYVLDVMSFGYALHSIRSEVTGGVSISLTNARGRKELDGDREYNLEFVAQHPARKRIGGKKGRYITSHPFGDILQGSTWHEVRQHIATYPYVQSSESKKVNTEVFGLVVCAGEGGWKTFEKDQKDLPENVRHLPQKEIYYLAMNAMWHYVSPKNGVMCVVLNPNYDWSIWVAELQKAGIDVAYDGKQALRFVKTRHSPKKLPRMSESMTPTTFYTNR